MLAVFYQIQTMDFIQSAFTFITDKSNKFISKLFLVFSILTVLIMVDNIFGYTYYSNIEKKLTQIEKINSIVKDTAIDIHTKNKLTLLRKEIIEKKNIQDYLSFFIKNISLNNLKSKITNNPVSDNPIKRNFYLQYISTAWLELIFLFIITVSVPKMIHKKRDNEIESNYIFFKYIVSLIGLLSIGLIHTILYSLIPIPFGIPFLSYILNFSITLIIILIVNKLGDVFDKKNRTANLE